MEVKKSSLIFFLYALVMFWPDYFFFGMIKLLSVQLYNTLCTFEITDSADVAQKEKVLKPENFFLQICIRNHCTDYAALDTLEIPINLHQRILLFQHLTVHQKNSISVEDNLKAYAYPLCMELQ